MHIIPFFGESEANFSVVVEMKNAYLYVSCSSLANNLGNGENKC